MCRDRSAYVARGAFGFAGGVDQGPPAGQHDGDLVDAHRLHLLDQERLVLGVRVGEVAGEVDEEPHLREPQVPGQERLLGDRHRPQTRVPRGSHPTPHRGPARCAPPPTPRPIGRHRRPTRPRASQTPSSATRPAWIRFHSASRSTSSSDSAASGSSPGRQPRSASAPNAIDRQDVRHPRTAARRHLAGVVAIDHAFESTHRYRSIATPIPDLFRGSRRTRHGTVPDRHLGTGQRPGASLNGSGCPATTPARAPSQL